MGQWLVAKWALLLARDLLELHWDILLEQSWD
jgi:hypothetical protein